MPNFAQGITLRLIWKKRGKSPKPQFIPEVIKIVSSLKLSSDTSQHSECILKSISSALSASELTNYIHAHLLPPDLS